jgi:hypothetical protein
MKTVSHLVYTHSDYSNVFSMWHTQIKTYFPFSNIYLLSDSELDEPVTTNIRYDDSKKYTDRMLSCLEAMEDEEVVIFQHEDMPLYDKPLYEVLDEFVTLVSNDSVDMIRLLRVVPELEASQIHPFLYKNPPNNLFSIQPTIIKVKTLKKIFGMVVGRSIWEAEMYWQSHLRGYKSMFCYTGESKRGMSHYDSKVFPYIATAVNKGEWNMTEYAAELNTLFERVKDQ